MGVLVVHICAGDKDTQNVRELVMPCHLPCYSNPSSSQCNACDQAQSGSNTQQLLHEMINAMAFQKQRPTVGVIDAACGVFTQAISCVEQDLSGYTPSIDKALGGECEVRRGLIWQSLANAQQISLFLSAFLPLDAQGSKGPYCMNVM
jgi:hypothetical protein